MILTPDEIRRVLAKHPEIKSIDLARAAGKSPSVVSCLLNDKTPLMSFVAVEAISGGLLSLLSQRKIKKALADTETANAR